MKTKKILTKQVTFICAFDGDELKLMSAVRTFFSTLTIDGHRVEQVQAKSRKLSFPEQKDREKLKQGGYT